MTQIAIVQPAAPQIPPAGPPANSGSQEFSSHFEKAISKKQEQVNTRESEPGNTRDKLQGRNSPATPPDNAGQKTVSENLPNRDGVTENAAVPQGIDNSGMENPGQDSLNTQTAENQLVANVLYFALPESGTTSAGANSAVSSQGVAVALPPITTQSVIAPPAPLQETLEPSTALPEETVKAAMPQNGQKPATDTLLAQLQQLIENSDEKGTVTITRESTSHAQLGGKGMQAQVITSPINYVATSESSKVITESPHVMLADGWNTPNEKSDQQVTSLRQNTQQQYYEAKINGQAFGRQDDSTPQDRQQGNESATQAQAATGQTASTASPSLATDHTNTFAQTLTTAQNSPLQPGTEAAKPVTLPSGAVVHEQEVMQQVIERFQIARRTLDTQINIKLHPAELGELKIDLTVKEGSIRANVVAQSQHAQEIIEKNMSKLRSVLEENGFTIETITVTSKSDSTTDADLLDRQLFSQNDYTPQSKKRHHDAEAAFRLDETFFPAQPATTGVNVKI